MSEQVIRRAIGLCFFASGAAGLVYQVLWARQLSLIFGVTTYAVATVLATFTRSLARMSYYAEHRRSVVRPRRVGKGGL